MKSPVRPDFASFVEVARCLNSSLDLHAVLGRLLDGVDRLLQPSTWSLLLRDEPTGDLEFVLARGAGDATLVGQRLRHDEGIAGHVASNGETLLICDVSADQRFSRRMDDATGFATRSIVAVPVRASSQVIGVIEILNALDARAFDADDVEILEAFAAFAGIAIDNARIHGALVEANRNDPLTGLRNSTWFLTAVDEAVHRGGCFAVVFFDMDRFKPLVDTHGHVQGSNALAEVGRLLGAELRPGEVGCRFGGDEFAFLLPGVDGDAAEARAGALAERIAGHAFLAGSGIDARLGASFGWAAYPQDAGSATEMLNCADQRMYAAKRARRMARD
jgi:diguanylate cyclase (GGDEF)-like protein